MRKLINIFLLFGSVAIVSCGKFLDVNTNVNAPTTQTPPTSQDILAQALTYTAANASSFNTYGAEIGGYAANAGGYGGFGSAVTYQYNTGDFKDLWADGFDNLEDYQFVIEQSKGIEQNSYFVAVAKIMKAYTTQLLVDAYNDLPVTEALVGEGKLTPKYDKAQDIYKSLATQLDSAILLIDNAENPDKLGNTDVVFGGDMVKWKQLANTLKLRLIIRGGDYVSFANKSFSADGFITEDVISNPGYIRDNEKQNPTWDSWAFEYTGGSGNASWIPSKYVLAFYDGIKISDSYRGSAIYYQFPETVSNQLGNGSSDVPKSPTGSAWYSSSDRDGSTAGNSIGVLKGPDAGVPLMLAAESYFLQAEANLEGLIGAASDAAANFNKGITASFKYLYKLPNNQVKSGMDPESDVANYMQENKDNYLVNFDLAKTADQKLEAIITQKYIAVNFINSQEGWNDYRRTGFPKVVKGSATSTFASTQSSSTRPDKLPTRIMYPNSEYSYNPENVPKDINVFSSLIFWAKK